MKKLLSILVLSFLLSGNAYSNDIKIGMSFYEVRKILKNKFGEKLAGFYPLKRTSKKYLEGQIKVTVRLIIMDFIMMVQKNLNLQDLYYLVRDFTKSIN